MTSIDSSTGAYVSVDGLEVSLGDGVLSLTLNRPDSLNSLTATMLNGIADALDQAAADPQVKVVRLAGAGRGFSSGAGISADDQSKKAGGLSVLDAANRAIRSIVACPRPVVSVVQGPAAGVGASLALACDVVLASDKGYFMLAFTKIGLMPDGGASALVAAAVGRIRAMRMALLADKIHADEALQAGLVTAVYPVDEARRRGGQGDRDIGARTGGCVGENEGRHQRDDADRTRGRPRARARGPGGAAAWHRLPRGHQGLPGTARSQLHRLVEKPRRKKFGGRGHGRSATIDGVSTQIDIQKPVVDAGRWRVLAPFRSREYSLLMAAVSLSIFADGMFAVVLALQVIELDNNPVSLSIVTTCWGAAFVAFVLVGGITADRIKQRTIIIATESVNVIASSAIAVLGLVGALEVWHLAVASAAMGAAAAFFFPAYSAILPRILPADQLLAANGVEGVVRPVFQRAVGPAIAGIVVGATFPAMGATTVAVLFAVGLAAAGGDQAGDENACRRTGSGTSACVARPTGRLRLHAPHSVAAVDAALREHVRAGGTRPDRGAAAVHREGPVRRRRQVVRLHPGVLRDGQRVGCARRCRRDGYPVATCR